MDDNFEGNFNISSSSSSPTHIMDPLHQLSTSIRPLLTNKGSYFYHININGLRHKFSEINDFLQFNAVTFFACTETRLDIHSIPMNMLSVQNYHMIRVDRDTSVKKCGGGLIAYVSETHNYEIVECDVKFPKLVEVLIVKVFRRFVKPVIVILIYRNPDSLKSKFLDAFTDLQVFLSRFDYEKIFMGDFNYNLLHYINNFDVDTHKLYLMCKSFNLWQLISGPTYQGKSLLDHIYVTDRRNYVNSGHFSFGGSDHDLCFVVRRIGIVKVPPVKCLIRSVKNVDWTDFGTHVLNFQFNLNESEVSIDQEVSRFNNHIMNKLDCIAPLRQRLVKRKRCPWFNDKLKSLCNFRDKLREQAKLNGDWKSYRAARNNVSLALTRSKNNYFKEKFGEKLKSESLWDTINELTSFRKKKCTDIVSILDDDDKPVTDKVLINNVLAKKLFINRDTVPDQDLTRNYINTYSAVNDNFNDDDDNNVISDKPVDLDFGRMTSDIQRAISETKNKNRNDNKYVPIWLMKKCCQSFSLQLAVLFMHLYSVLYVPMQFRSSIIVPLYKGKGARNIAKSYRPIVLLNSYCKIFERLLFYRINERIECQLINEQHAYRPNRSCHSALDEFTTYVHSELDKKNGMVGAVFIDLRDAFSSISHEKLIRKLLCNFKLNFKLVTLVFNNLVNRVFSFKNDHTYYSTNTGIGQGSILGSLCFSAFLNDVKTVVKLLFLCYADDIVLYVGSDSMDSIVEQLTKCLVDLITWCDENDLNINFDKTKCMYFHNERVPIKCVVKPLLVNGIVIERVFSYKYLGLILDPSLNFKLHYDSVFTKVCQRIKLLHSLKRVINEQAMRAIVNTQVHSVIDYCIDIWTVQNSTFLTRLQKIIDNFLLSYYFPRLAKSRSWRKVSTKSLRNSVNIEQVRKDCNLLTVEQRSNYVILKYAYKSYAKGELNFSGRTESYKRPNLCPLTHRTEAFKRCIRYRRYKIWNSLPKDWDIGKLSYAQFQALARDFVTN